MYNTGTVNQFVGINLQYFLHITTLHVKRTVSCVVVVIPVALSYPYPST